jgi:Fe-Mn family superoxide dismutase
MINVRPLPYKKNILAPKISSETLDFHYNNHYVSYVKKLNSLIVNTQYEKQSLEDIVIRSYNNEHHLVFNNAAQIWNHDFYWNSLSPDTNISKDIALLVKTSFISFDKLCKSMIIKGMSLFGSGWLWLVQNNIGGNLRVITTSNANNPIILGLKPILGIDLWEHAYYIDYRNNREAYLTRVVRLLNWNFANNNSLIQ